MPQRCYICDVELVPIPRAHNGPLQDNHATRDHVPPDGLFCDPKPSNLITVPCCHKHNRKHSGVDERLRMFAALEIGRNEGGEKILSEKVFGSTLKKMRQPKFVTKIATTLRNETVATDKGPMPVAVFTVDGKEILECVADITRGLLRHFYPQFNYHGHDFMVVDIHSATLAKGARDAQLRLISEMVTKTQGESRGNQSEFRFWRQIDERREHGAWLLVFYETVAFTVCHSKIPFRTLFEGHCQGKGRERVGPRIMTFSPDRFGGLGLGFEIQLSCQPGGCTSCACFRQGFGGQAA
jgi:hypothetical protein